MGRLVILSNRIPTEAEPSGGLVVALHDALSARGGLWVGAAPDTVAAPSDGLKTIGDGPYERMVFELSEEEHAGFYLGYANSVLWPLFHWRSDLIRLDAGHAATYREVNRRVARLLAEVLEPDDRLWVHDYHFLPIAEALRDLGLENRIGFFLHTPFPHPNDLFALPERRAFTGWLSSFDLVGLQAERDVAALLELFRGTEDAEMMLDGAIRHRGRRFAVMSFPIGIDVEDFTRRAAASEAGSKLRLGDGEKLVVGVDRLDYSKGLVYRFDAFAAWLDEYGKEDACATLLQIAQPSREALDAYQSIRESLEAASGRINGAHGRPDWTPIRLICRGVPRDDVAGLYRRADAGLVTPLADGMNLVAKEFVAAQDPDDPGVLILSHFAGAAEQMETALTVNPYDSSEVAAAIDKALNMGLEERQTRHAELLADLTARDIRWWTDSYLKHLMGSDVLAAPA